MAEPLQWKLIKHPVFRKMGYDLISAVLCAVSSVAELFPKTVLRLFNDSEHMMEIGVPAVRFMVVSWIVSIPNLVIASAMQGLSLPRPSTILTYS